MNKADESFIYTLCEQAFPGERWTMKAGKSGMNNTTRYVETSRGKYVLRIYETHRDRDKVEVEHEILKQLSRMDLPFRVPKPYEVNGSTIMYVQDSDQIASWCEFIPGDNPVFDREDTVISFGRVTGELIDAFESMRLDKPVIYPPYYELDKAHPSCPPEKIAAFCEAPGAVFHVYQSGLKRVKEQLEVLAQWLPRMRALPHHMIHGDLNASNVLTSDGVNLDAVLDFEFATRDVRVMELAVALSELTAKELNQTVFWDMVHCFTQGFAEKKRLSKLELEAVPILMKLRRLDVFVHFLGRYLDGVDDHDVLLQGIFESTLNSLHGPQVEGAKWERCIQVLEQA
ncbi:phosphotransferase [Marinicrinis lubricantis]|uniref:Phosphotransferase n=1 Tax=Marinicrinis lubricantis TaxID=2086470 RepID=A0ABW1IS83_9BACL